MDYKTLSNEIMQKIISFHKIYKTKHSTEHFRGELRLLFLLSKEDDKTTTPGKLGNKLGISNARITAMLNNLERKGFITREMSVNDRRVVFVTITKNGEELINKKQDEIILSTVTLLKALGEKDSLELNRIITKILKIADEQNRFEKGEKAIG